MVWPIAASVARFASPRLLSTLLPKAAVAARQSLPGTTSEWLWRLGAEGMMSGASLFMAPPQATMGDRLGIAGEGAASGLVTSFLGGLGGRLALGRVHRRGTPNWKQNRARDLQGYRDAGDLIGMPLAFMAPMPFTNSVYDRIVRQEQDQQQQQALRLQQDEQRQEHDQFLALLPSLTGTGMLMSNMLADLPPPAALL